MKIWLVCRCVCQGIVLTCVAICMCIVVVLVSTSALIILVKGLEYCISSSMINSGKFNPLYL